MSAAPVRTARPAYARSALPGAAPSRTAPVREAPHLRAVAAPQQARSLGLFAMACIAIVLGALATVLLLNTVMARGAYEAVVVRREIATLHQERATLLTQLEAASAPAGLATTAQSLGMVPAQRMGFVFLEGGSVLEASGY